MQGDGISDLKEAINNLVCCLMSDGENTDGLSAQDFERYYQGLPAQGQEIRTFTVLFGNVDEKAMTELADLTGGRMFDGTADSLSFIFKQIRGYQ